MITTGEGRAFLLSPAVDASKEWRDWKEALGRGEIAPNGVTGAEGFTFRDPCLRRRSGV